MAATSKGPRVKKYSSIAPSSHRNERVSASTLPSPPRWRHGNDLCAIEPSVGRACVQSARWHAAPEEYHEEDRQWDSRLQPKKHERHGRTKRSEVHHFVRAGKRQTPCDRRQASGHTFGDADRPTPCWQRNTLNSTKMYTPSNTVRQNPSAFLGSAKRSGGRLTRTHRCASPLDASGNHIIRSNVTITTRPQLPGNYSTKME